MNMKNKNKRTSLTRKVSAGAFLFVLSLPAIAYDTGSMTCEQIGEFAAAVVSGKHTGKSLRQQLRSLDKTVPASYYIERRNLTQIIKALYSQPWAKALSEDGAYDSFKADCEAQQ